MAKICPKCDRPFPPGRKADARYCSQKCYYEAKKQRSKSTYQENKLTTTEIKRNVAILERFTLFNEIGLPIHFSHLDKCGFNWGVSTGEISNDKGIIYKELGKVYAYHLDPKTKIVHLWIRKKDK